jgi:hypothetical protein
VLLLLPVTAEVLGQSDETLGDDQTTESADKCLQDIQELLYETMADMMKSMMDVASGFGGLASEIPAAHVGPSADIGVYAFFGAGANVPAPGYSQGVERQGVIGADVDQGPYVALVKAKGERYGTSETYVDHHKGAETVLTTSGVTSNGITMSGIGTGLEVPFLAGAGVGTGTYGTMGHRGFYVAVALRYSERYLQA